MGGFERLGALLPVTACNRGRKYCLQVVGLVTSALAAEFADMDADGSGDITIDELRAAMRRLNANVTEEEVQQKWRGMDLNGDGKVSKKEFRSAEGLTGSKGHRQLEECDVSELMETIDVLVAAAKKNQVRAQRGCATSLFGPCCSCGSQRCPGRQRTCHLPRTESPAAV